MPSKQCESLMAFQIAAIAFKTFLKLTFYHMFLCWTRTLHSYYFKIFMKTNLLKNMGIKFSNARHVYGAMGDGIVWENHRFAFFLPLVLLVRQITSFTLLVKFSHMFRQFVFIIFVGSIWLYMFLVSLS